MPRVLVTTDEFCPREGDRGRILVDEEVTTAHLDSEHSRNQIFERLLWGIEEGCELKPATGYREVPAG